MLGFTVKQNKKRLQTIQLFNYIYIFHRDELGFIAFVFVVEKHRKKGLGGALIRHLSKKISELGDQPYACVVPSNISSRRMLEGAGLHRLDGKYVYMGAYIK